MWQKISGYVILLAIAVETAVFAVFAPGFLSVENAINVALSIAVIGVLAVGMTFVILTGGIDLSIGSVVALAGVAAAIVTARTGSVSLGFAAALGVAIATGVFNGATIAYLRVPPFVVTLAMLTAARGLAFILSEGRSVGNLPAEFGWFGRASLLQIPLAVWLMLVVFAAGWFVLRQTTFGRRIYAVGGNRDAAFLAGVNVRKIFFSVYLVNGFIVGLAAIALASRLGAGVPNSGLQYELDVIAAVVVGGTSLIGGRGSVITTFLGTAFIGVLNNGLNLWGIDSYSQKIALGAVILIAVVIDRIGQTDR